MLQRLGEAGALLDPPIGFEDGASRPDRTMIEFPRFFPVDGDTSLNVEG